jgi:hypothetical protein
VDEGVDGLPGAEVAAVVEENVIGVAHSILLSLNQLKAIHH